MLDLSKSPEDLLIDLINHDNPNLPIPVKKGDFIFGAPTVVTGDSYYNTEIMATPRNNSGYLGYRKFKYRRIDLAALFKNISPEIWKYQASTSAVPYSAVVNEFVARYGVNVKLGVDIADGSFPAATTGYYPVLSAAATWNTVVTSLAYVGSFQIRWVLADQELANLITQPNLDGRLYPGGNDFSAGANHKHVLDMEWYGIDFTEISSTLQTTPTDGGFIQAAITFANAQTGGAWKIDGGTPGSPYNCANWTLTRGIVLPSAAWPDANGQRYNRLGVITAPTTGTSSTWGVGKLYVHYNV